MNDRDQSLQDAFDRHLRGEGPPPETDDDPEAAAYQMVFAALSEEPEGDLPDDFAERVADRVGLSSEPAVAWADLLLLLLALAGFGGTLVAFPTVLGVLTESAQVTLRLIQVASSTLRFDVILAVGLVLAVTLAFDTLLSRWRPARRALST